MVRRVPIRLPAALAPLAVLMLLAAAAGCDRLSGKERLAEVHLHAAQTYLGDGQPGMAVLEAKKALEIAPEYPKAHLMLAVAYGEQGQFDKAFEGFAWYTETGGREPAKAYRLWGTLLLRAGRPAEAVEKLQRAVELEPEVPRAYEQLGLALAQLGRHEEAVQAFQRMHELSETVPVAVLAAWGQSLLFLRRFEEAVPKLEAVLRRDPEHVGAATNLALALQQLGGEENERRAIELFEEVVEKRPGDPAALHNLGKAYLDAGRAEEAYDLIQRALAATPKESPLYERRKANLALAAARIGREPAPADAPNVVLVVIDTLRADHLGVYGYERNTSPHLDAFAREGVVLEEAISQAPWTAASIASLFTGLYPSVHGLDGGVRWGTGERAGGGTLPFAIQKTLHPGQTTLAEEFRKHGYRTAGFVSNVYVNSIFGFSQGFDEYHDEHSDYSDRLGAAKRRGAETNELVFRWIEQKPQEPFFLFVHYNDPHWPYDPPPPHQEWIQGYEGELTPEKTSVVVERQGKPITDLSEEDLRYLIGLYDGEVAYADARFGELLARLEGAGFGRDLVIAVTADHGEEFLDHGSASHGYTLYEEMIHVPLVIRAPGRLEPGRVREQVRAIDLMPTLLELAGLEAPEGIQGKSVVALLQGDASAAPGDAFAEATYVAAGEQKAIRTPERTKLIFRKEDGARQLFDLETDPKEQRNLASERPELAEALTERVGLWETANQSLRTELYADAEAQEIRLDEDTRKRLEALGYIQ